MPTNQTTKRQKLARNLMTQAGLFMEAVNELKSLSDEYTRAGLAFADPDFETEGDLQHVNAADMAAVITKAGQIATQVVSSGVDVVFYKAKR